MTRLVSGLELTSDYVDKIVSYFVLAIMVGLVTTTTLQVVCREFFAALSWTEELSRYFLVWGTFFAATLAYKRGSHISIQFIVDKLPRGIKLSVIILTHVLAIFFFVSVAYYALKMMKMQVSQISPALFLPMRYVYGCIPVSMLIMMIHALSEVLTEVTRTSTPVRTEKEIEV